jgi:hypothetical protein
MHTNQLTEVFQSAYKELHSTETALLRVHNDILRAIDGKEAVFLVLLDLSAAFDTLDHSHLSFFLRDLLGVDDVALQWFTSYLTNRSQRVTIEGLKSAIHYLLYGVPQGSVLGPILFCIYILSIGNIIRKHGFKFHIYADDTQVYIGFQSAEAESVLKKLEACIEEVCNWMTAHKLKLNDDKTEFMVISSKHILSKINDLSFHIGSAGVHPAECARNLGVMMDCVMNMNAQVRAICRSAYFHLHNIGAIRKYLTKEVTAQLIHSFVTSRLDYCNCLLYGITDKSLNRLKKVQNTAARIITLSKKYDNITPIFKDLHWLPIHLRIHFKILLITYKILNGAAPAYLNELIVPYVPSRSLRSSSCGFLIIPRSRTCGYGDRAFSVAAPKLWNDLPERIRTAGSVANFKTMLKTHLFNMF